MADDADARQGGHALVVRQGNGEEEFIVVAAVEGAGGHVHVELRMPRSA